ncbi:hypothetical protein HZA38_03490 [Candidatus Peregrinibacteria bacterium]|nr:hypothetical protein [Candidatus Peregrinibacteria bacterium]
MEINCCSGYIAEVTPADDGSTEVRCEGMGEDGQCIEQSIERNVRCALNAGSIEQDRTWHYKTGGKPVQTDAVTCRTLNKGLEAHQDSQAIIQTTSNGAIRVLCRELFVAGSSCQKASMTRDNQCAFIASGLGNTPVTTEVRECEHLQREGSDVPYQAVKQTTEGVKGEVGKRIRVLCPKITSADGGCKERPFGPSVFLEFENCALKVEELVQIT